MVLRWTQFYDNTHKPMESVTKRLGMVTLANDIVSSSDMG